MFWRKTTITRADRDRLIEATGAKANALGWAIFIDELQWEIARARVVEPARVSPDIVTMHSKVQFVDLGSGQSEVYTLVYPKEADLSVGKLSVLSSMGTALLGTRQGDVVNVFSAVGPRAIRIKSVLYQPESAGAGSRGSRSLRSLIRRRPQQPRGISA